MYPMKLLAREQLAVFRFVLRWSLLATPLGIVVGSACAFFLWSLDQATAARFRYPDLLYLLPAAGIVIGAIYAAYGTSVDAGNNLIVDQIHEPGGGGVPLRMAPLILVATVLTHLFGGSAGREGTAVQMGGSLASSLARWLPNLSRGDVRIFLMAGVAAGFGGVFGTPVAGAIFALEVVTIGRMNVSALLPCLLAGLIADKTCAAWGIGHLQYHVESLLPVDGQTGVDPVDRWLMAKVMIAAIAFGAVSFCFAEAVHGLQALFRRWVAWSFLRPAIGGILVIVLVGIFGTRDYLGLGVTSPNPHSVTILSSFQAGGADPWSWLLKILFTAVTIGSGFKGGEVTPLFFVGATMGNTLAVWLGAPVDLFAALGLIAVFAAATNTPIACTVMGIELFGGEFTVHYAMACSIAYLMSGSSGIYLSQRIAHRKGDSAEVSGIETLRTLRESRRAAPPSGVESSEDHSATK